jgi:hypothetical protein
MEEIMRLAGEELDLKLLARAFPTSPVKVEKHGEFYFLFSEADSLRGENDVLTDGSNTLAEMNAIMLAGDPKFRPPRISGISHKLPDGSLGTIIRPKLNIQVRTAMFLDTTLLGGDGKVVENKGPTENQVAPQLAAKHEPLRRARIIYGSLNQDWANLYKVLEAIEDGNGGEAGLIAKNFVADGDIKNFKATANSFLALGLEARHGTTASGITLPRMTLEKAQEMFRKLFHGWIEELKTSAH